MIVCFWVCGYPSEIWLSFPLLHAMRLGSLPSCSEALRLQEELTQIIAIASQNEQEKLSCFGVSKWRGASDVLRCLVCFSCFALFWFFLHVYIYIYTCCVFCMWWHFFGWELSFWDGVLVSLKDPPASKPWDVLVVVGCYWMLLVGCLLLLLLSPSSSSLFLSLSSSS